MTSFKDHFKTIVRSNYDDEEYDMDDIIIHNTSIELEKDLMKYLLFEFSKKVSPGKYKRVYKAIKLVKIKRVPKKDLALSSYLKMQEGVLTGYNQNNINYIQIMANIVKPYKHGLVYAYGVQGVSDISMRDAMHEADVQMAGVTRAISGTFRTLEYIPLTSLEAKWIFEKLGSMDDMRILRGVPGAKNDSGRTQKDAFSNGTTEVEEQSEEFLIGMDDYEYMFVLTATRVEPEVLSKWRERYLQEATYYASLQQGQKSLSFGISMPMTYAANMGASQGWNNSSGENFGQSYSESQSQATGINYSNSVGTSQSMSNGFSHSVGKSQSTSMNIGQNVGYNQGISTGSNAGKSIGLSQNVGASNSTGHSDSFSNGISTSHSTSQGTSQSVGHSFGTSSSTSQSTGTSYNYGNNSSHSSGTSESGSLGINLGGSYSSGTSDGLSNSINGGGSVFGFFNLSTGKTGTHSDNESSGSSWSLSGSSGSGSSLSDSFGKSESWGQNNSTSFSSGISNSTSTSQGTSQSVSNGTGTSTSYGSGDSYSTGYSESTGRSSGNSFSQSLGASQGASSGTSLSKGVSSGASESVGTSQSISRGISTSTSLGRSATQSAGKSAGNTSGQSTSSGTSGSSTQGLSGSMGLGPSLSFGKTFAWEDREVTHLLDLLDYSTQRIVKATNNLGMWFTDIYIATESEEASSAATQVAMSAWHDYTVMTCPLQVYKPSEQEKQYLFKHMSVFSPSLKKEGIPGEFESYKYTTMLLSDELNAYSHPPRVNVGGIQAAVDDPPVLTIPGDRQNGEVFLGYVANTEAYSLNRGYRTDFKYTLRSDEIHHAYISGASRSGKTVAARRLVAETYNHVRRGEKKKRMRFLIMDPKQDWRALAKVIPADKFRFYSLGDPTFHPIRMNLMKIPKGVYTERYADKLREIFIRSYGLGDRGFQILGKAINEVYTKAGCYDSDVRYNTVNKDGIYPATELSKDLTLEDVCRQLEKDMEETKARDRAEAIQRVLDRMDSFAQPLSAIYTVFCNRGEGCMGIDDLLGADDVVVLESYGMDTMTSNFIFGLVTSGVYQYAVSNGGFVKPDDQYETVLVIEEANQVLINDDDDNLSGANPFEVILDQSAGYGMFIWTLTQKISDMPRSVLANSALKIIGRQDDEDDIKKSIVQIGKDAMIADRVFKNWLPDQPTGWFIIKSSRNRDFTKNAPVHVLIEYMDVEPPTNEELDLIIQEGELKKITESLKDSQGNPLLSVSA